MAEQDDTGTQVHYGARPVGGTQVYDYGTSERDAAQAGSLPGWEMVRAEVTEPQWEVIPNPLAEGHPDPSGS